MSQHLPSPPEPLPDGNTYWYLRQLTAWLRLVLAGLRAGPVIRQVDRQSDLTLTWTFDGTNATLSAGLLLLRGAAIEIEAATIALSAPTTKCWLFFAIQPGVTPEPEVQTGDDWPGSVELGVHGWYPLAEFQTEAGAGSSRVLSGKRFHHAGGTIDYSL